MRATTVSVSLAVLLLSAAGCLAQAQEIAEKREIQVGDEAPAFECFDDRGEIWRSADHVGKKVVVFYFFPSDFSFCCTRQAMRYQARARELAEQGIEVVAISGDSVRCHQLFKAANGLTYTLLSDPDGSIARQFGVPLRTGGKAIPRNADGLPFVDDQGKVVEERRAFTCFRWTFVVGATGVVERRDTSVSPLEDCRLVLEHVKKISAR